MTRNKTDHPLLPWADAPRLTALIDGTLDLGDVARRLEDLGDDEALPILQRVGTTQGRLYALRFRTHLIHRLIEIAQSKDTSPEVARKACLDAIRIGDGPAADDAAPPLDLQGLKALVDDAEPDAEGGDA